MNVQVPIQDVVLVLLVVGLAMIHPALALVGAAAYYAVMAVVVDRRTPPAAPPEPVQEKQP